MPVRIRHVDSLRAVAAGLVIWLHYAQFLATDGLPRTGLSGVLRTLPGRLDVGLMGVTIFFAVSGFVICRSFSGPREGSARRFLIRRFCRLYPAYWVSLSVGWLAWRVAGHTWSGPVLAANATMAPGLFGQPLLLGVYWTLAVELLFYGLCLALHLARCLDRRALLATTILVLVWLNRVLKIIGHHTGFQLGLPPTARVVAVAVAVMFWGVLFRLAYDATGGFRRGVANHGGIWLVGLLFYELIDVPDPNLKWCVLGYPGPVPAHAAVALGLVVFTLWVGWVRGDFPVLTYLGTISYSLYLFHLIPVILTGSATPRTGSDRWGPVPFWARFLVCALFSTTVAAGVYRWVERPAIGLGKRWAARRVLATAGGRA